MRRRERQSKREKEKQREDRLVRGCSAGAALDQLREINVYSRRPTDLNARQSNSICVIPTLNSAFSPFSPLPSSSRSSCFFSRSYSHLPPSFLCSLIRSFFPGDKVYASVFMYIHIALRVFRALDESLN